MKSQAVLKELCMKVAQITGCITVRQSYWFKLEGAVGNVRPYMGFIDSSQLHVNRKIHSAFAAHRELKSGSP